MTFSSEHQHQEKKEKSVKRRREEKAEAILNVRFPIVAKYIMLYFYICESELASE